jgi:hypothetical protein
VISIAQSLDNKNEARKDLDRAGEADEGVIEGGWRLELSHVVVVHQELWKDKRMSFLC